MMTSLERNGGRLAAALQPSAFRTRVPQRSTAVGSPRFEAVHPRRTDDDIEARRGEVARDRLAEPG